TATPRATLINPMARQLDAIGGPLRIAHAEGVYLYDDTGRSWIDCETGAGVFGLGHRNPVVSRTFERAIAKVDLGNHHLISGERAQLAEDLNACIGAGHMCTVFNVSAAEAIDCAIKFARGVTGKTAIVCADNAYHGCSGYALAAGTQPFDARPPRSLPGCVRASYGDAEAIARALDTNSDVAAVLIEPIAVEAGCMTPPEDYVRRVCDTCRAHGVLSIVDESVTGLGRTGAAFAATHNGAAPDVLVAGRALGGGVYPIYATCHREELDAFYVRNPFVHVSTFGGGEVGCAAARTALTELSRAGLLENVRQRGEEFRSGVSTLIGGDDSAIRDVRGVGLVNAIELRDASDARGMQCALFQCGVLCRRAVLAPQALLFIPPLTITSDQVAVVLDACKFAAWAVR
ncbi:MAG: aspartate aminotransferase family protein, partial [Candidatus Hydrogenedentes bacterium]|nr:aspartate aminotransferase family protein [Candidatus Hydrogenedentota bacterium]